MLQQTWGAVPQAAISLIVFIFFWVDPRYVGAAPADQTHVTSPIGYPPRGGPGHVVAYGTPPADQTPPEERTLEFKQHW